MRKNDASYLASLPPDSARRLRLVPSKTATGNGMLYAMTPDRLTVTLPGGKPQAVDALFAPVKLAGSASGFQALLPSELAV